MGLQQAELGRENLGHSFGMFVTDYDGTLLADQRQINSRDLATLKHLNRLGITTVIATGRSLFSFERSLATMGLSFRDLSVDYLVFSTGAGTMDLTSGRIIRSLDLGGEDIREACRYFDKQGFDYMVHGPIPDTPYFQYKFQGKDNPDFQARIDLYPDFGTPMDVGSENRQNGILKGDSACFHRGTEVLAIVPAHRLTLSQKEIQAALNQTSVIFATSPIDHRSVWIEVFHREVSKSRAVAWLAERLDLGAHQVVAVGNDYNDQDLLEWAGMGCLVENGPRDMGVGCVRVRSNNCCGVSHAAEAAGLLA